MTVQETGIIMDILTAAYPRFCGGTDRAQMLALWAEMFADDNVAFVAAAVKSYIATDMKGYPPHIGAIKNAMHSLTQRNAVDEDQAVELLRRAVSNSAYEALEEFERLPPSIQRMAGSPNQLYEWSQMDPDAFNSVIISHFRKSWRARQESQRQDALLPADVKNVLSSLTEQRSIGLGEKKRLGYECGRSNRKQGKI